MKALCTSMLALALAATGCVDLGEHGTVGVYGQTTVGPGMLFLERGELYNGTFERAGLIGADGQYRLELPSGGRWGLHLYFTGNYLYLPMQLDVDSCDWTLIGQDRVDWDFLCDVGGLCDWVQQPPGSVALRPGADEDLTNNPVQQNAAVCEAGPPGADGQLLYRASVDVTDPDGDLGSQVLVHPLGTAIGLALNPPGSVIDGVYPPGHYVGTTFAPAGTNPWRFIVADHGCSNTPIVEVRSSGPCP